jgi:hypothetical protein
MEGKAQRPGYIRLLDVDPGQKPDKLGLTFRARLSEDRLERAAQRSLRHPQAFRSRGDVVAGRQTRSQAGLGAGQPEHVAQAIGAFEARRLKRRAQKKNPRAHENVDRRPGERRGASEKRGTVRATQADRRVRADLVRVTRSADPLQHAPEGARHFGVARRELPRLDLKQSVADGNGARIHADDPPALIEEDGAGAQVIEAHLDSLREYDASGRGDGANPFDVVAYPFEFADFPVLDLSRPPLDTAANLARHKLEADETPELERIQKFF